MVLGNVTIKIDADISGYNRKMLEAAAATKALAGSLDSSRNQMAGLVQAGLAVGPALVGIGAAAVPAIAGLTNQFAFAAAGAGVTAVAFQGIGDALKALNTQAIDPTDAHLKALALKMNALGPAGQEFVEFLQRLRPEFQKLQDVAQAGLFPGLERGITDLFQRAPEIQRLFGTISTTIGELFAEAGENLADPRWDDFFTFLQREAQPTLVAMARTLGNFAEGFAELWMAFEPLSQNFSTGFLMMSRDFAKWADGLSQTQGFQDFIAYIERIGPKAADTLGALSTAFVDLLEAAAPVGEQALPVLELLFNILSKFLNTPFGPAFIAISAGLGAVSTAMRIANFGQFRLLSRFLLDLGAGGVALKSARGLRASATAFTQLDVAAARASLTAEQFARRNDGLKKSLAGTAKVAGFAGGLAFVMSGLDDKMGLTNTASLTLAGSIIGPWGAAIGGGVGLALDFAAANNDLEDALNRVDTALAQGPVNIDQQVAAYKDASKALADFKKDIGDDAGFNPFTHSPKDLLAHEKNLIEGFFGKSDVEEAQGKLKDQAVQLEANKDAARDAALAEAGFGEALKGASEATKNETYALIENVRQKNLVHEANLNAFNSETGYRRALKDAWEQAKKNNAGINGNSEAALKNRDVLGSLVGAWDKLAAAGEQTQGDMRRARSEFVKVAVAMGVPIDQAKRMARALYNIPDVVRPKIVLNGANGALETLRHVKDRLIDIDGFTALTFVQVKESLSRVSGGRVPPGYAGGGRVPGVAPSDPTVDNVLGIGGNTGAPILVRSGEWIINEPQSRKNDPWLAAINRGLNLGPYPTFAPHYAEGGMYDGGSGSGGSWTLDYDRLAAAMARLPATRLSIGRREFALVVQDANNDIVRGQR